MADEEQQIEEQATETETEAQESVEAQETEPADNEQAEPAEEESEQESDKEELSDEQFGSMSDEEFDNYMSTGKIPDHIRNLKTEQDSASKDQPLDDTTGKDKGQGKQSAASQQQVDYKAVYEQLFQPFKANGKEIQPKSVDDIVSLMQMGANYAKKMKLIAPSRRLVESLNKANVGEQELSFLLDVYKGDKKAISKLLKDRQIDTLDISEDDSDAYTPNLNNIATAEDVDFGDALQDMQDYATDINNVITNTWDAESKAAILGNPALLRALGEEFQMNRFHKAQEFLESERTFGRYKGIKDLDAYIDIVRNRLGEIGLQQPQAPQQKRSVGNTKTNTKPRKVVADKSKAAPNKSSKTSSKNSNMTVKDLFDMPEEEFLRLSERNLI